MSLFEANPIMTLPGPNSKQHRQNKTQNMDFVEICRLMIQTSSKGMENHENHEQS